MAAVAVMTVAVAVVVMAAAETIAAATAAAAVAAIASAAAAAVARAAAEAAVSPAVAADRAAAATACPPQVVGTGKGTVKFFNTEKGFGFIQQDGGGEDVFVHISAVERAGLQGLAEGQELEFNLVDRGGKVSAQDIQVIGDVIPVEGGRSNDRGASSGDRGGAPQRELTGEKATGTVKFFNAMKGFGFIVRDDGQPDAFVHISAVERSGLSAINEGERYQFDIEMDRRGKHSAVNLVPAE